MSIYCDGDAPDFYRCDDVVARKDMPLPSNCGP